MAEFAKGGTSQAEVMSSASTHPVADSSEICSGSRVAIFARMRSRASWTVSTRSAYRDGKRVEEPRRLPVVPVAGLELGRSAFAVGDHVLVEAGGHHLVGHGSRDPQLDQRLDLVGHHLVAGCLDGGDHIVNGRVHFG